MRLFAALFLCLCVLTPGELCGQGGPSYVEGFFGTTSIEALGFNSNDDETAFGFWGGYSVSSNFAIEAGFGNYGEFGSSEFNSMTGNNDEDATTISSFNIGFKGSVPLEGGVFLQGKIGLALWEIENVTSSTDGDGDVVDLNTFSFDGEDIYFGVGVSYMINETSYLTVDYLVVELSKDVISGIDVGVFSLGVGFMF